MKLFLLVVVCFVGTTLGAPKQKSTPRDLALPCDAAACTIPECHCSSSQIPGGLTKEEVPQAVMLTFDDAVSALLYNDYYKPLLFERQNPNGCPISATFFIPHEYTDYSKVNDLWIRGHDIAMHSITHQTITSYWQQATYDTWVSEFAGERELVSNFAKIPAEELVGTRVPFLQIGGNNFYQMLHDEGFKYDSSWSTLRYASGNAALWPYTLDYATIQDCPIPPCPNASIAATPWVMPMLDWMGPAPNEYPCAMIDTCIVPEDSAVILDFMKKNFNAVYETGNRAPIGVYVHAAWLQIPSHLEAYEQFLNYLQGLPEVYLVSVKRVQEWMENPTPLANLADFEPWNCLEPPPVSECLAPVSCYYKTTPPGGERYMTSCAPCPPQYPWLGNPLGQPTN